MKNLFIIILVFYANIFIAQKQNNNWVNGNRLWNFNNSSNGNFIDSYINTGNLFRESVSNVSDRNTGDLLFYTNGITIYNKNFSIMENGEDLVGTGSSVSYYQGNNAAQGSLIIPIPGDSNKYYVFSLAYGSGLRYAVVDMSLNSGLGKAISKNTLLTNNYYVTSMTSCVSTDGGYWLITQNNAGDFLSYKITTSGISSPIVSLVSAPIIPTANSQGLKISPNKQYLYEMGNKNLFNFDNSNGNITFLKALMGALVFDDLYNPCSAEFSEDSNVLYSFNVQATLGPSYVGHLHKYIISTGKRSNTNHVPNANTFVGSPVSLQRHSNGNIYMKQYNRDYGLTDYSWYQITNTNSTDLNFNNVQYNYYYNYLSPHGYTFPQLVEYPPECINTLTINQNITSNVNYKTSDQITASSIISPNLTVNYSAGNQIRLLPGFQASGNSTGVFRAYIKECNPYSQVQEPSNRYSSNLFEASDSNKMKIYPNPVSNILTIDNGAEKLISWQLYDYSGKMIRNGNSNTINVQSIPNASYILKIKLEKTQISKTIIVKH